MATNFNTLRAARYAKLADNPPASVPPEVREKYIRMMRAKQAMSEAGIEQPGKETPLDPLTPVAAQPVVVIPD
jgi:hypothetical protein